MTEENDNKVDLDNLTTEQLAKLFQNPTVLGMAVETAKGAGMIKTPPPAPAKTETFDLKAPEMPDVSEMESTAEVSKAMAKYTKELNDFHEKQRAWDKKEVETNLKKTQVESQAREINKFASDPKRKKHFQNPKVYADIERLFNSGDDVESAYNKALKLHDIKEDSEEKKEEKKVEEKPKISNLSTSSSNGTPAPKGDSEGARTPAKKSSLSSQIDVASAAERAFDKLTESNPDILKDLE